MFTIYHNPRCSKSREGLQILEDSGVDYTLVKYMDDPLSLAELRKLVKQLGISPIDLVRQNETLWKEMYKGKSLSDEAILQAMAENPRLIERPIVVSGNRAIIGRPPEKIRTFLKSF